MTEEKARQCILCGARLPEGVTVCPKCGTKVSIEGEAEPKPKILMPIAREDLLKNELPKTVLPNLQNTCPFCSMVIAGSETRCPRCGIPLKTAEEELLECPNCGALAPLNSTACPKCGASFVAAEEVVPKPEPPVPPSPEPIREPPKEILTTIPGGTRTGGEGLVNGRGAVNGTGMVNGRGAINGTGLVNGTGMVNGTGRAGAREIRYERPSPLVKRWQFLAVLVALVVVIPTFVFMALPRTAGPAIDGEFRDWSHATMFDMQAPAASPEVSVSEWSVKTVDKNLYLYLQTEAAVMGTSNVDSFYLFVDSDNDPGTGYFVSGIGADYLVELHGWDSKVQSSSLMGYDSADGYNWTEWSPIGSVTAAIKGDQLEAMAEMPLLLGQSSKYLLLSQNNLPDQAFSVSYPVPATGGALVIQQLPGPGVDTVGGTVQSSSDVALLRLVLKCEGADGVVHSIAPTVDGVTLLSQISEISLSLGEPKTIDVRVDSSLTPSGTLVSAVVTEINVFSTFSDVVIVGDGARAYLAAPPAGIVIDGAFGDWIGKTSPDNDSSLVTNPNINITEVGSVNSTAYAAFFVSVQGQIFQGSWVPSLQGKPSGQGGGGGQVAPHRKTGEDVLRIYIDNDMLNSTGQLVQKGTKVIGADYLIEVDGLNGEIVDQSLMEFSGGNWSPIYAVLPVAIDSQRIELKVLSGSIGSSTSFSSIIETTDWRDRSDWAWTGVVPDPWVIDSSGNTYMSDDGSTWSYLGTPSLEPGDRIVDIAVSIGAQGGDIFLVTNTGRTYYWVPGTSTNWTLGENNTIDTATYGEAVSMAFYQNAGAWLLTKNGSYFWLMDAHKSTKQWTYQDTILPGITDFTDIVYQGGTMYAMRSAANSNLSYSNNGNSFTSFTNPTGSTSTQSQFTYLPLGSGSSDDRIFVLCQNGNIRYSADGGTSWSALGNLPTPTGGNTSKYVALGIDPSGYMWVVTDTGYTYRSTDTTTFNTFTYTGQSPIGSIVAILPTTAIPEFPAPVIPFVAFLLVVFLGRFRNRGNGKR